MFHAPTEHYSLFDVIANHNFTVVNMTHKENLDIMHFVWNETEKDETRVIPQPRLYSGKDLPAPSQFKNNLVIEWKPTWGSPYGRPLWITIKNAWPYVSQVSQGKPLQVTPGTDPRRLRGKQGEPHTGEP